MAELSTLLGAFIHEQENTYIKPCSYAFYWRESGLVITADIFSPTKTKNIISVDSENCPKSKVEAITPCNNLGLGLRLQLCLDQQFGKITAILMENEIVIWSEKTSPRFINLDDVNQEMYDYIAINFTPLVDKLRTAINYNGRTHE